MRKIAHSFAAAQIAEACGGRVVCGDPYAVAHGVSTDTRSLRPGEVFFALVGPNHDAHDYLPAAGEAGARTLVAQRLPSEWPAHESPAVVLVSDTRRALLALAAWHRRHLRARVAAVTGSYGKSTVKEMTGAILTREHTCTVAPASYNNRIGVALTLLSATLDDDFVVLELGTNHPGEIDELAAAAKPDLGVITAIGEVHLEGLGSIEGVREAKAELIPHLPSGGTLVLNADDALCSSLAERFDGQVRSFGLASNAWVRPERVHAHDDGWQFDARGWVFRLRSGPQHNVINAAAAVCAATALGASLRDASQALAGFCPSPMRYERVELGRVTFVRDCYNSNPPAMLAALKSFLLERNPGRKFVVCGDMLELGERGPALHREVGAQLAASGVHGLVAVGELARHLIEGWHKRALPSQCAFYFRSAEEAWSPLWWELEPGDAVLIKGSRAVQLEKVTDRIADYLGTERKEAAA
ncbi:MAG: UDP-N-acetylmuramoyl-tripeptide--D-alanyl-D-alanine ligase [Planctomycetota bacterium]